MTEEAPKPIQVSITWEARREGNEGFVREIYSDGTERSFGPMRSSHVPAFIEARRRMWKMRMENRGHKQVPTPTHH